MQLVTKQSKSLSSKAPFLKICVEFFGYLNQNGIRYCHWKSNSHLDQALLGNTDLDLLIHSEDKARFEQALHTFNFKEAISPPRKQYPGMADWLGFDQETGRLIHLHLHYQIVLGQKYFKNHFLPIEEFFFQHRRMLNGVAVPCAELELLVLIIRAHMKLSAKPTVFASARREIPYPPEIYSEMVELWKQSEEMRLKQILAASHVPLSEDLVLTFLEKLQSDQLEWKHVWDVRKHVFKQLKRFQRQSSWVSMHRHLLARFRRVRGLRAYFRPEKKTLGGGGKMFAIVGADGSGKSTLTKEIHKWLSWKVAVRCCYFGIPKTVLFKTLFHKALRLLRQLRKIPLGNAYRRTLESGERQLSALRWVMIARKRFRIFEEAQRFAANGGVVISDRYPLAEFQHMDKPMDGSRIRKESPEMNSALITQEEAFYSRIGLPTQVFVLATHFDELRRRKGGQIKPEYHRQKSEAINAMKASPKMSLIDGNRPYPEVLLDVKQRIWGFL